MAALSLLRIVLHILLVSSFGQALRRSMVTMMAKSKNPTTSSTSARKPTENSAKPDAKDFVSTGVATLLKCEKISKAYTGDYQFKDVSFTLGKGQRVGLIGINGAGKVN